MGFFEMPHRREEFQRFLEGHRAGGPHVNYRMFQEPAAYEPEPAFTGLRISGRDDAAVPASAASRAAVDSDPAPLEPAPRPHMRLAE